MKLNLMSRGLLFALMVVVACLPTTPAAADQPMMTDVPGLLTRTDGLVGQLVSVQGSFLGWRAAHVGRPPVTRSDWLLGGGNDAAIYCTGPLPTGLSIDNVEDRNAPITVLGTVQRAADGTPYLVVTKAQPMPVAAEPMVSVAQVLFDLVAMKGKTVGMLGVLTKGYDSKGRRLYLLADPTGAITVDRLPKLYPRGTILRLRGVVDRDAVGLPILTHVEIVARVK